MRLLRSALLVCLIVPLAARGQQIPRNEYIKYVPLTHRRLFTQTPESQRFALFGDTAAPGYVDADHNGIDDTRDVLLNALAVRFSPFLVRTTTMLPMDWKKFIYYGPTAFPLFADRWEVSTAPGELVGSEQVDFRAIGKANCQGVTLPATPPPAPGLKDDCTLLGLLAEFDPDHPLDPQYVATRAPGRARYTVLYFDFPGTSPDEWRDIYSAQYSGHLPLQFDGFKKVYVHPFLTRAAGSDTTAYELVLQYWFFYPMDDGGNKHEGDWEHINVIVSPRSKVTRGLDPNEITELLNIKPADLDGGDPVVIKRVDHYVHDHVIVLDYTHPNVYLPHDKWMQQVKRFEGEQAGAKWIYTRIRQRAYTDREETILNTHPIGYIGGDSKGLELLLNPPGARNRDSHATFPFAGIYQDVGPAAAAEQVKPAFVLHDYTGKKAKPWPSIVERYDTLSAVEVIPDWERVIGYVRTDPHARAEWSWLLLPIRWGWPAMVSPFAGVIGNAETGNLSPVGPTYSIGWNRSGGTATFSLLKIQEFSSVFPLSPPDLMRNDFGFLNAPLVILTSLPPFDLVYKGLLRPIRSIFPPETPSVFVSQAPKKFRVVGVGVGASWQWLDADTWSSLFFADSVQTDQIINGLIDAFIGPDSSLNLTAHAVTEASLSASYQVQFYLDPHWTAENWLRHSHTLIGADVFSNDTGAAVPVRGKVNMWEYAGAIHYSILTKAVRPYLKLGYGLSWYRLEGISVDGVPIDNPTGPWIRQPTIKHLSSLLPNEWSYGAGLEVLLIRAKIPMTSPSVSVVLDYSVFHHNLGISDFAQDQIGLRTSPTVHRRVLSLSTMIAF